MEIHDPLFSLLHRYILDPRVSSSMEPTTTPTPPLSTLTLPGPLWCREDEMGDDLPTGSSDFRPCVRKEGSRKKGDSVVLVFGRRSFGLFTSNVSS